MRLGLHHLPRARERRRLQRGAVGGRGHLLRLPVHGGEWRADDERRGAELPRRRCVDLLLVGLVGLFVWVAAVGREKG